MPDPSATASALLRLVLGDQTTRGTVGPFWRGVAPSQGQGPQVMEQRQPNPTQLTNPTLFHGYPPTPEMRPVTSGPYHDLVARMNAAHPDAMNRVRQLQLGPLPPGEIGTVNNGTIYLNPTEMQEPNIGGWPGMTMDDVMRHEMTHVMKYMDGERTLTPSTPPTAQDVDTASRTLRQQQALMAALRQR